MGGIGAVDSNGADASHFSPSAYARLSGTDIKQLDVPVDFYARFAKQTPGSGGHELQNLHRHNPQRDIDVGTGHRPPGSRG